MNDIHGQSLADISHAANDNSPLRGGRGIQRRGQQQSQQQKQMLKDTPIFD